MDRKVSDKQLKREKLIFVSKWVGGIAAALMAIFLVTPMLMNSVKEKDLDFSVVSRGNLDITIRTNGIIRPGYEEVLNSPISSTILDVYKNKGDSVDVGTPILKLDVTQVESDIATMLDQKQMKILKLEQLKLQNKSSLSETQMGIKIKQMRLERMKKELNNELYLDSLGASTQEKIQRAHLDIQVAELELDELLSKLENNKALMASNEKIQELELNVFNKSLEGKIALLEDSQIPVTRKAIVSFVNNEIGTSVAQGSKIATLSDISFFKVEAKGANSYTDDLKVGRETLLKIEDTTLEGFITSINPVSQNGIIEFSVSLKDHANKLLRSGMSCDLFVIRSRKEACLRIAVPREYIGKGRYSLFVREGDRLIKKVLTLGESNYEYVEVISGLEEGEKVVISDMKEHKGRTKIKVKRR